MIVETIIALVGLNVAVATTILMVAILEPRTIIAIEVVEVTITVYYDTRSHRGRGSEIDKACATFSNQNTEALDFLWTIALAGGRQQVKSRTEHCWHSGKQAFERLALYKLAGGPHCFALFDTPGRWSRMLPL